MALCERAHCSAWFGVMQSASSDFGDTIKMLVPHVTPALMHFVRFFPPLGRSGCEWVRTQVQSVPCLAVCGPPILPRWSPPPSPWFKKRRGVAGTHEHIALGTHQVQGPNLISGAVR